MWMEFGHLKCLTCIRDEAEHENTNACFYGQGSPNFV
jgi:hypothetical protein